MKKIIARLLCVLTVCALISCEKTDPPAGGDTTTTTTTTTAATSSAEQIKIAELTQYLSTVDYNNFEVTEADKPYFMGRWFEKEINGEAHMVTVTDGSLFYFLVEGAESVDVNFTKITSTSVTPKFAYSIDGGTPVRQDITNPTVTLPDTGKHTVRIIADCMNESEDKWVGEKGFALKSVTTSAGGALWGIKPKDKVIFYYGDSITEGCFALSSSASGNSATNAYPWHCSEKLGAVTYSVGYGASGITVAGSFNTFINAIDYNSKDRLVADGITPDVIVIAHGTNERTTNPQTLEAELKAAIDRLREKYGNVPIVYVIPTNQHFTKGGNIRRVMQSYSNAYVVSTTDWGVTMTDSCHPNAAGAKTMGEKLADALIEIFGAAFFN